MTSRSKQYLWLGLSGAVLLLGGVILWKFDPALDLALFDQLRSGDGDAITALAKLLSAIGGLAALGPLVLLVCALLYRWNRWKDAIWLFVTIAIGRILVDGLKSLLERPRPELHDRLADVVTYSFPSSHAAGSMMTWLALATLLPRRGPAPYAVAILIGCLVGWSRLALGVHWPSDVLAGLGFGMAWVALAARWLPSARR